MEFDVRYVLSVKDLICEGENSPLWEQVYTKLDEQRIRKVQKIKSSKGRAASAGAGLLLQYWLAKWGKGTYTEEYICEEDDCSKPKLQVLSLETVLNGIENPWESPVIYGKNGKPRPNSCCFSFNLSHSEEYVAASFSDREHGIDIQFCREIDCNKIINRFFTQEEKCFLDGIQAKDKALFYQWFYRLWTRKEAYGKLTGDGVAAAIGTDLLNPAVEWKEQFKFQEYNLLDNYQVTCCVEKRNRTVC